MEDIQHLDQLEGGFSALRQRPDLLAKLGLFALAFPLGFGLTLWGAAMSGAGLERDTRLVALAAFITPLLMVAVPPLFRGVPSPLYFGVGGTSIMVLMLATSWQWGRRRACATMAERRGLDLQGLGYLCFGLAAWNTCGIGGMPGFALYPEKMARAGTHLLVAGNFKIVMAYFVLGWLLTTLGLYRANVGKKSD